MSKIVLLAVPGVLMSLVGLVGDRFIRFGIIFILLPGVVALIIAGYKGGLRNPWRSVEIMLVSNLAYWISALLWAIRSRFAPPVEGGVSAFAGVVAFWAFAFLLLFVVELPVLANGLRDPSKRVVSLGEGALFLLQMAITYRAVLVRLGGV